MGGKSSKKKISKSPPGPLKPVYPQPSSAACTSPPPQPRLLALLLQSTLRGLLARKALVDLRERRKQRKHVVFELLETEKSFLAKLTLLRTLFAPAVAPFDKTLIPPCESMEKFSRLFVSHMEERLHRWTFGTSIGDVLAEHCTYLSQYVLFVNAYPRALAQIARLKKQPEAAQALAAAERHPDAKRLDLASFLMEPVQRVPRYCLLTRGLLEWTDREHRDFERLTVALKKFEDAATLINTRKKEAENLELVLAVFEALSPPILDLVQPHRFLVMHGTMMDHAEYKDGKMYHLYLFNDLLVKASVTKKKEKYEIKDLVDLRGTTLLELDHADHLTYAFEVFANKLSSATLPAEKSSKKKDQLRMVLGASCEQARFQWMQKFTAVASQSNTLQKADDVIQLKCSVERD